MDSLLRYIRNTKVIPMVMVSLRKDERGYYWEDKFEYLWDVKNPAYDKYIHDLTGIEELCFIFNGRRYKNIWDEELGQYHFSDNSTDYA